MKENSFESVKSDLYDEQDNINKNDNESSIIFENQKDEIKIDKKLSTINESKIQIKKSLLFSNINNDSHDINNINTNDILNNSKSKLNMNLKGEKGKIENLNSWQKTSTIPFLDIPDKKNTKIILLKVIDQNYYEGHLRLKNNLNSEYLIFKILMK